MCNKMPVNGWSKFKLMFYFKNSILLYENVIVENLSES